MHELALVPVGAVIALLHIPLLALLARARTDRMVTSVFLVAGVCILWPVALVCSQGSWWVNLRLDEGAVGFAAAFESPALGLLVATVSASGLIAFSLASIVWLARTRLHSAVCRPDERAEATL